MKTLLLKTTKSKAHMQPWMALRPTPPTQLSSNAIKIVLTRYSTDVIATDQTATITHVVESGNRNQCFSPMAFNKPSE